MAAAPPPRLISRVLRVNHAGEHGAVAIYKAQIRRARRAKSALVPWLEETLSHEEIHRARFREAMPARGAKPCRAMWVWGWGGAVLGWISGGADDVIYATTAAVERTVHTHLIEQIAFLDRADPDLAAIVRDILTEEDDHLAYAEARHDPRRPHNAALSAIISALTEILIFLSTRGDSLRLRQELRAAG